METSLVQNAMAATDLTEDQRNQFRNAAQAAIKALEKKAGTIQADESGFEPLLALAKLADPDASTDESSATAKDSPSDPKGTNGIKVVWDAFKNGAQQISKWANDFLTQLENAPLTSETKQKVVGVCKDFKGLLESTSEELQEYRNDVKRKFKLVDVVLSYLIPDKDSMNDLKNLSDADQVTKISEWAKENKEELTKAIRNLSEAIQDNTSKNKIKETQKKWTNLSTNIENVLQDVSKNVEAFRAKMSVLIGIVCIVGAAIGAIAMYFTGGAVIAILAPYIGTVGVWTATALSVLTVTGLAVFGAFLIAEPEIARTLNLTQEGTVSAINDGLKHIASQADAMESILHFIYKEFCEVQGNDPKKDLKYSFGKIKVKDLIDSLTKSKKSLKQLEEDILGTEAVVDNEIVAYGEKVYKPLLRMFK